MSWRTLSLWRRSTLKETRYRRTRSTGERSCWHCPAFARSTPPSSAFEAPVYSSPAGFSVAAPALPALPAKEKKEAYVILNTPPASLNCAVTPYANTYSNFELTHTSFDTRVHSLTHAMVLFIRLDINRRKIAPTHPQWFLELSFAICFLDCFACGWQKQGAMALAPLQLHCNHMRRESIQCEGRPKCHKMSRNGHVVPSLYIHGWRLFTIRSIVLKKDTEISALKGNSIVEQNLHIIFCQYCQSSHLIPTCFRPLKVTPDSHRNMHGRLQIQVGSGKLSFKSKHC